MKVVIRLLALARWLMLNRQARELRRLVQELPISAQRAVGQLAMAEIQAAARMPQPHLYGSEAGDRYQPWGDATQQAFLKSQARNPQVKLRGMALWIAVVYHETRESPHPQLQAMHREVLGLLGVLKGTYSGNATRPVAARAA